MQSEEQRSEASLNKTYIFIEIPPIVGMTFSLEITFWFCVNISFLIGITSLECEPKTPSD